MYHGEKLNAWTHLLGAVAAAVGSVWLLVMACLDGSPQKIVSAAIYGVTLVLLYSVLALARFAGLWLDGGAQQTFNLYALLLEVLSAALAWWALRGVSR